MKNSCLKVCFLIGCFAALEVSGQNDFFFNHYMFNPSYFNPAWTGLEDQAFVAAHHRTQWAGYDASFDPEGAPTTQLITAVIPARGRLAGMGISFVNDRTGPLTSIQARIALSTSFEINSGQLYIGIMPSLNVASINANFRPSDPRADDLIPIGNESQYRPNLHAGAIFQSERGYYVGVSAENILQPSFDFSTDASNQIEANYNVLFGRPLGISRNLILKPTALVRSDLNSYSLDLTGILEYDEKMWGGLAFRRSESVSILLGYSFLEDRKLRAGYSFDYVISDQDAKEPTSHEIFIRYNLPDLIFGGRKAVKTPRFAF